jgi:predicted ArsR family transcriptional regulator
MAVIKVNAMSYAKLIKELHDGPYSFQELADNTGLHYHTVREYVNCLHRERLVHIALWEKDRLGRDCKPLWVFGRSKDKKREKMTQAERQARHRSKKRGLASPLHMMGTIDQSST